MRTYGRYMFAARDKEIRLKMEPQAATRFKRVFERAEKKSIDFITVVANPENARELEWFMDRYPLVPRQERDAKLLDHLARKFDRMMNTVAELTAPGYEPPMVDLAFPARHYQLLPAAMLEATGGVLVGDEVGLGKTVEAIVALLKPNALPALVVTLTSLPKQFQCEIQRFAPGLNTYVLQRAASYTRSKYGHVAQDLALAVKQGQPMPDVVITSYSKIHGWAEWAIKYLRPQTVIWDEVQEVRRGFKVTAEQPNHRNIAMRMIAYNTPRRMGLSATPIHNEGSEIHNVMEVILPGALGEMGEFKREWCASGGNVKEPKVLGSYLRERGLFIRRTKAEVGRELPALTISEQYCETDPHAIEVLKTSSRAIELAQMILSGKRQDSFTAQGEFDMFVRQQTGLAKAPYVAAFVRMLLESEKPIVLAGWHHAVYDVWADLLKEFEPAFFTGRETAKQKDEAVRRFRSGETKLFIMSLRSGAGLDGLQYAGCSDVVFGELDWTPAVHEQFIGRVRRDGNDTPVTAWYLVADEGSDPEIAQTLGIKRAQLEGIRDPKGGVLAGTVDHDAVKRLAASFLKDAGKPVPAAPPQKAPIISAPPQQAQAQDTLFDLSEEGAA